VSGETLAAEFGISRVAVNKHIASLRALGYQIDSKPHVGYRLVSAPDACIPEEVGPRLRDSMWTACDGMAETVSTNEEAKRLARNGAAEGTVVVAGRQTGGRGRLGRTWESPEGGAYCSFVLRPNVPPSTIAPLPLVVAVGAARALTALGVPVRLKWPNDLLVGGRKLGGILLEVAAEPDCVEWVVVGCGVNVASGPGENAAAVRDFVPMASVPGVAAAVLDAVAGAYREFLHEGFGALRREYEALSALTGRVVHVANALGEAVAEGAVSGLGEDGALVLSGPSGETRVHAGEVTLRR